MHTNDEFAESIAKQIAALPPPTNMSIQQMRGKRAMKQPKQNPKPARQIGRVVPPKIHSTDLNPMSAEIEALFLSDLDKLSGKTRLIRRAYVPGEAAPYALPENNRTVVKVTPKQRLYEVDGKAALYVDLRHRNTPEEKAEIHAKNQERRKNKIPGGEKGRRPFQVVREIIMEREV